MLLVMPGAQRECQSHHATHVCADCSARSLSVCSALPLDEMEEFERLSRVVNFDARSALFTERDPVDFVYNITQGMARLYKLLPDGRRQVVGFALPGDFLGLALEDSFSISADALTPMTACRFSRKSFSAFLDTNPRLLRKLHERVGHELTLAQDQMVVLGQRTAEERVASFVLNLSRRYEAIGQGSATIPLPMSRQDIADYLGLTIETVSRTFTRLAKSKHLVVVPGGVRLLNLPAVQQLTGC